MAILYYAPVIISDTEPSDPEPGWIWIDTTNDPTRQAYIYLSDQWIPFAGA